MEYSNTLTKFGAAPADAEIRAILADVQARLRANGNEEVYRRCFRSIDLTSLGATDSHEHIERFVAKAVRFPGHYPDIENVASVCVYPVFVETAGLVIADSGMTITSVAGGFPSSQTYLEVKMLETAMAVENGADEIDVVISLGEMLSGEYDLMGNEIETLRNEVGDDVVLKVILESGVLARPELIHRAAVIAMEAGADFIKTSTGKQQPAATPEAALVMCQAIKEYHELTGIKVGFKPAGGINCVNDALIYYTIVKEVLGEEWLNNELFRLGTSRLANLLLSEIKGEEMKFF